MAEAQKEYNCDMIFIRCFGQHDQIKLYKVFGLDHTLPIAEKGTAENLYKIIINESVEQVTLMEHDSENILLQSSGGLFDSESQMTIIDPVNNTLKALINKCVISAKININLAGITEWWWNFNAISSNNEKDLYVYNQKDNADLFKICGMSQSITVATKIFRKTIILNKTLQLIVTMASLKYYYNVQKYYQHPVPVGILGLMNRGVPCFPSLSILQNMSRVRIRLSCVNQARDQFLDVFDEGSKEILMVVDVKRHSDISGRFNDTYGITQFSCERDQLTRLMFAQDHAKKVIGTICITTGVISATNDCDSYLLIKKVDSIPSQQAEKHCWQLELHDDKPKVCVADFYQETESRDIVLSMFKGLDVHKKALILTHAMTTAVLFFKIFHKIMTPFIPGGYPYRKQQLRF